LTDTEITFTDQTEAADFFSALSYRRIPTRGAVTLAAAGYSDIGVPIITFARQHLADRLTYTLTEIPRKRA
jgi:hypothetical protein